MGPLELKYSGGKFGARLISFSRHRAIQISPLLGSFDKLHFQEKYPTIKFVDMKFFIVSYYLPFNVYIISSGDFFSLLMLLFYIFNTGILRVNTPLF